MTWLGPFAWPGWLAVWPNIVASIIWATPAFVAHHLLLRRHHRRLLDEHAAQMRAAFAGLREQVNAHRDADLRHRSEVHAAIVSVAARLDGLTPKPPARGRRKAEG